VPARGIPVGVRLRLRSRDRPCRRAWPASAGLDRHRNRGRLMPRRTGCACPR